MPERWEQELRKLGGLDVEADGEVLGVVELGPIPIIPKLLDGRDDGSNIAAGPRVLLRRPT